MATKRKEMDGQTPETVEAPVADNAPEVGGLPGLEEGTPNLPEKIEGQAKADPTQGFESDIDPAILISVSGIMEGRILATLTDLEAKGKVLHQTERDATREMQSNLYACVLAAVGQITSQRDIVELFRRACFSSELKWKELHGLDAKASLKVIDERTHSPVKLAARYQYWKSVTAFGLGAPRRGETAFRAMYPVANVKDGETSVVTFDSWYTAVSVGYERYMKAGQAAKKATGRKGTVETVQKPEAENTPALPVGPFSTALTGEATRKAMLAVGKLQQTMIQVAALVRLCDEAHAVGISDEMIADLIKESCDLLRGEIKHQRDKAAAA